MSELKIEGLSAFSDSGLGAAEGPSRLTPDWLRMLADELEKQQGMFCDKLGDQFVPVINGTYLLFDKGKVTMVTLFTGVNKFPSQHLLDEAGKDIC